MKSITDSEDQLCEYSSADARPVTCAGFGGQLSSEIIGPHMRLAACLVRQMTAEEAFNEAKAATKAARKELAGVRALEKERQRNQAKPAYEGVRARKEASQKRMFEAADMRAGGLGFAVIGEALGVSASRARQIVMRAERFNRWVEGRNDD